MVALHLAVPATSDSYPIIEPRETDRGDCADENSVLSSANRHRACEGRWDRTALFQLLFVGLWLDCGYYFTPKDHRRTGATDIRFE